MHLSKIIRGFKYAFMRINYFTEKPTTPEILVDMVKLITFYLGGLKILTTSGRSATCPHDTEDLCRIYGERFLGRNNLDKFLKQAEEIVTPVLSTTQFKNDLS